uniref:Uncharacterized protein n=1 Tax=Pararge aegeria TaxID=116150 RepID=S4PF63_9NEOP
MLKEVIRRSMITSKKRAYLIMKWIIKWRLTLASHYCKFVLLKRHKQNNTKNCAQHMYLITEIQQTVLVMILYVKKKWEIGTLICRTYEYGRSSIFFIH